MTESRMKNDSSPSPSPRTRRRGDKDSGEYAIGVRCLTFCLLSLSQRERTKVRDCHAFQASPKSLQEHHRVLRESDDSKNGLRRSLVRPEISLGSDRVSRASESHALSRLIRLRVSKPGNRNPRRRDQTDAAGGIYKPRTFDCEDVARESVRNRSHSCGGNERASSTPFLISPVCCEKRNYRPLTSILSPRTGRGGN